MKKTFSKTLVGCAAAVMVTGALLTPVMGANASRPVSYTHLDVYKRQDVLSQGPQDTTPEALFLSNTTQTSTDNIQNIPKMSKIKEKFMEKYRRIGLNMLSDYARL